MLPVDLSQHRHNTLGMESALSPFLAHNAARSTTDRAAVVEPHGHFNNQAAAGPFMQQGSLAQDYPSATFNSKAQSAPGSHLHTSGVSYRCKIGALATENEVSQLRHAIIACHTVAANSANKAFAGKVSICQCGACGYMYVWLLCVYARMRIAKSFHQVCDMSADCC